VLSSQAKLAGHKAVTIAADKYQRIFPMLMAGAGTVKAARVVILGVGRPPLGEGAGQIAGRQVHRRAERDRRERSGRGSGRLCAADAAELAGPAAGYAGLDNGTVLHGQDHDGVRECQKGVEDMVKTDD